MKLCSVHFSRSVVPNSLQPHKSQHARPTCPSPTPGVHPNSCPLSRWCHPTISSSVVPFSSCPQSFPASGSFQMSQLFAWGGQSTGVSTLASFLTKKFQGWSPSEWTGWISLQSKGLSRVFSNTTVQKHQFLSTQLSAQSNSHLYMTTGQTIALTRWTFVGKVMSLLFNMLTRLVITFLLILFHHFMANRWGNNGNWEILFLGTPKSLKMVTVAMKLKDAYSLEEKLWPT